MNTKLSPDQKVLATARRLLAHDGRMSITMDRLAAESGVSRATLYRRFGGRMALLTRLASEHAVRINELELDADVRSRILQATHSVISAIGSVNITIEQVAIEAGFGVATIYRHFGTKENLLQSLAEQFSSRRTAKEILVPSSANIEADLKRFAQSMLQIFQKDGVFIRLLLTGDPKVHQLFSSIRSNQETTFNTLSRYFSAQIKAGRLQGQNPKELTVAFVGMLLGFAFVKPNHTNSQDDPALVASNIARLFLSGCQNRTSDSQNEK